MKETEIREKSYTQRYIEKEELYVNKKEVIEIETSEEEEEIEKEEIERLIKRTRSQRRQKELLISEYRSELSEGIIKIIERTSDAHNYIELIKEIEEWIEVEREKE